MCIGRCAHESEKDKKNKESTLFIRIDIMHLCSYLVKCIITFPTANCIGK